MAPSGCIVKNAHTLLIRHLVIANVQVARIEHRSVQVQNLLAAIGPLQLTKVLLSQIDQLLVLYGSRPDNHHILSKVHSLVVLHNHLPIDPVDILDFAENGQAHHVLSVHVEVHVLH